MGSGRDLAGRATCQVVPGARASAAGTMASPLDSSRLLIGLRTAVNTPVANDTLAGVAQSVAGGAAYEPCAGVTGSVVVQTCSCAVSGAWLASATTGSRREASVIVASLGSDPRSIVR